MDYFFRDLNQSPICVEKAKVKDFYYGFYLYEMYKKKNPVVCCIYKTATEKTQFYFCVQQKHVELAQLLRWVEGYFKTIHCQFALNNV